MWNLLCLFRKEVTETCRRGATGWFCVRRKGNKTQRYDNTTERSQVRYLRRIRNSFVVCDRFLFDREQRIRTIRKAFMDRLYIGRSWSQGLIFCEILNLFNVVLQIYITNKFLGGQFLKLGVDIAEQGYVSSVDPLEVVFPKVLMYRKCAVCFLFSAIVFNLNEK